jgi:hypothetical protein
MRYKEQVLSKIEQLNNLLRTTDFLISRGDQNGSLQSVAQLNEKLEELRGLISLEHSDWNQQ